MVQFVSGAVAFVLAPITVEMVIDSTSEGLIVRFAWMLGAAVGLGVFTVLVTGIGASEPDANGAPAARSG